MQKKKILASILSLVMMLSLVIPQNILAFDDTAQNAVSANRAKMSYIYLGKTNAITTPPTATTAQPIPGSDLADDDPAKIKTGDFVWIGVQFSGLSKVRDLFDSDKANSGQGGLMAMSLSVTYDNEYLQFLTNVGGLFTNTVAKNYPCNNGNAEKCMYLMTPTSENYNPNYSEKLALTAGAESSNIKDAFQSIQLDTSYSGYMGDDEEDSKVPRMFHDGTAGLGATLGDAPVLVATFAFKVRKDIPAGRKVIQGNNGGERFALTTGYKDPENMVQWIADQTETSDNSNENLKNYFDLVDTTGAYDVNKAGLVDLFPADNSTKIPVKTSVDGTVTDTDKKVSITEDNTKKKFSEIKSLLGTNPTKPGHTFSGWSLSDNGTVLGDNDEITFNLADATAGKTFYAVFTKDKVNYTAADFTVSDNTVTYNKAAQKPTVALKSGVGGTITNVYVGAAAGSAAATQTNQGTYKVFVDVTGDTDHNNATKLEVGTFTINKLEVSIAIANKTTDYTGSAIAVDEPTVTTTTGTSVSWADTGCSLKYMQNNKDANHTDAGTYNVVVSGLNANYSLKSGTGTGTLTINPKAITATLTTPADKLYTGQTQKAVTANVTGATLTPGTDYDISYKQNGADADPKNAGTYNVAFVLKNNNYSIASAPTGTYTIAAKPLNPTLVVTVSQNNAQSGPYTLTDVAATITNSDKVGNDTVNVTVSGTIAEADIKAGGNGKTVNNPTYKVDNTNYVIGTASVTANVTNLPVANDLDADTKAKLANQTMKASDANNTNDYLITKLANLPTTGQSNIAGNDGKVNIAWTVDKTYDAKGTKYTYTGKVTAADPSKITASISDITVEVTVTPVEVTKPTIAAITVKKGDPAPTLPVSGKVTVEGTDVNYTIAWVDASGTAVTELKTDEAIDPAVTYTGTVTYTDAPAWMTVPDTAKTVTLSYAVTEKDKTAIAKIEVADVTTDAYTVKDSTLDELKDMLPAKLEPKNADGTNVTDESGAAVFFTAGTDFTWEAAESETIDPKGKEYTFTAKFADTVTAAYTLPADPVTGKVIVTPVKAVVNKDLGTKRVKKGAKIESIADIGLNDKATITLDPAVAGAPVEYAVTNWTAPSTVTDITTMTSKTGKYEFTGTIDFTSAPWLTVDAGDDAVIQTVQVYTSGGGGGGGSSVGLTLSGTTAEGLVGDKVKIDAKVTGSTSKPTWKSSDEKVATVDNEGNIVMVGEGTATVTVTVAGVSKTVKVTVGKPEATPTPTPTSTPLIKNNLKPYASGYDGDVFLPENNITRAELATMIARLINGDDIADGAYRASFSDIADDAWYNKYVGYLESFGVLDGYDEDGIMVFKPEQTITRAEMATVITRAQRFAIDNSDSTFWDVENDYWAKNYITTLANKGIITGYADGSFGATNPLTRAEAVVIINRLLEPSTPVVTFMPVDISGHWAENEIILSVNERQVNGTEVEATPEPEEMPVPEATTNPEAEVTAEPTATPAA